MLIDINEYEIKQIINALDLSIEALEKFKLDDTHLFIFMKEETLKDLENIRKKFKLLCE